ncbi:MAG: hypothetical protein WB586_11230 [Chthoniobacterales bacterium]
MKRQKTGAVAIPHTVAWMKQNPLMTESAQEQQARRAASESGFAPLKPAGE